MARPSKDQSFDQYSAEKQAVIIVGALTIVLTGAIVLIIQGLSG